MLSSSSSFLPTRISKEVGKDIITLVSQIGNVFLKKEVTRMHHYMTFYEENGIKYAESWLQINFLSWCFCFWKIKKGV